MISSLRQRMHQDLQLAGLSEGNQVAYLRAIRHLAKHFRKSPDQLTETELRAYLLYLKNEEPLCDGAEDAHPRAREEK
jgi:hypothetical protein